MGSTVYLPVSMPDLAEQDQIVAWIGRETAKIDALVAKKERLIEQRASDPATYKIACTGDIAFNRMRMWRGGAYQQE